MIFDRLLFFWQKAASDLGLQLIVPYSFLLSSGHRLESLFLVKKFGAAQGMLIFGSYDVVADYVDEITGSGYGFSVLDEPIENEEYNVEDYIELLVEWGWSGNDQSKPSWL